MVGYVKIFDSNKTKSFKAGDNKMLKNYNGDKININFQVKRNTKRKCINKCLSLIMLSSVIRANKKYYPQNF